MDLQELLNDNESRDLLRLVTAGSVDDGKSTLIGRLLYESKAIYEDQLEAVEKASKKVGSAGDRIDLALLTDGLKAEREQGITIDVAYRYFATSKRKFIIADSPGHEQYTRNMVTGSSTANLMIILLDASKGVLVQTRRHSFIASLLRLPHVVVAINKMDLVDYSEDVYKGIVKDFSDFAAKLELPDISFVPLSALEGEGVTSRSDKMGWYKGPSLIDYLETIHIASDRNLIDFRFPVQYVSRPNQNFRGYMGTVASGSVKVGDEVVVLPGGGRNRVKQVLGVDGEMETAFPPLAATLVLENEVDISRGDLLVLEGNQPHVEREFETMLVWMAESPMVLGKQYVIKHMTRNIISRISKLRYRVDVNTLHRQDATELGLNEIGRCTVSVNQPLTFDAYRKNKTTGSFIVIDRATNNTVGAGMIIGPVAMSDASKAGKWNQAPSSEFLERHYGDVALAERQENAGHKPVTVFLTGLTAAGKREIAYKLERRLFDEGRTVKVLDGQNMRLGISRDLAFSAAHRSENLRRASEVARLFNEAGTICICSFVAPHQEVRAKAKQVVGEDRFLEVHVDVSTDFCKSRDKKGLYKKAENGEIRDFPGVTTTYEAPSSPDLRVSPESDSMEECVARIVALLEERGFLTP